MIEVHCLAPWLGCVDGVPGQSHVDPFTSTAITALRAEHNLGQQGGPSTVLAVVSVNIAIVQTMRASGNLTGVRVILAAWFTHVVETIGLTVFALNSLTIFVSGTDPSQSLITVGISLALVWDLLASIGVRVTEVSSIAVRVRLTSTGVISHTDWLGILTVEITVMAAWTAAIRGLTVSSSTVEAVVVLGIADLVEAHTLRVLNTDCWLTEVVRALVTVRTVVIVNTASLALPGLTVGTVVRGVGGRQVAGAVRVLALRVLSAATGRTVGAGTVRVTVTSTALVTVSIALALSILGTGEAAVDNIRPVTHRAQGVLERHVEGESPLAQTPGVLVQTVLTRCTLEQTGLSLGATLPEPAAVVGVLVVVRLLGDGIDVFGAVRDHAAVIGQTVLAGVVGDGVVIAVLCGLTGDQLERYHGYQQWYSRHFYLVLNYQI